MSKNYRIEFTGAVMSAFDIMEELLEEPNSLTVDGRATFGESSLESDGNGNLLGSVDVISDLELTADQIAELQKQFRTEFKVVEL